jgi:hypothetical protein
VFKRPLTIGRALESAWQYARHFTLDDGAKDDVLQMTFFALVRSWYSNSLILCNTFANYEKLKEGCAA